MTDMESKTDLDKGLFDETLESAHRRFERFAKKAGEAFNEADNEDQMKQLQVVVNGASATMEYLRTMVQKCLDEAQGDCMASTSGIAPAPLPGEGDSGTEPATSTSSTTSHINEQPVFNDKENEISPSRDHEASRSTCGSSGDHPINTHTDGLDAQGKLTESTMSERIENAVRYIKMLSNDDISIARRAACAPDFSFALEDSTAKTIMGCAGMIGMDASMRLEVVMRLGLEVGKRLDQPNQTNPRHCKKRRQTGDGHQDSQPRIKLSERAMSIGDKVAQFMIEHRLSMQALLKVLHELANTNYDDMHPIAKKLCGQFRDRLTTNECDALRRFAESRMKNDEEKTSENQDGADAGKKTKAQGKQVEMLLQEACLPIRLKDLEHAPFIGPYILKHPGLIDVNELKGLQWCHLALVIDINGKTNVEYDNPFNRFTITDISAAIAKFMNIQDEKEIGHFKSAMTGFLKKFDPYNPTNHLPGLNSNDNGISEQDSAERPRALENGEVPYSGRSTSATDSDSDSDS